MSLQGKGNVVRRMFADVDADVYVLADGDATYHAPSAPGLIRELIDHGWTWSSPPGFPIIMTPTGAATVSATAC